EQEGALLQASLGAPSAALSLDQLLERRKPTAPSVRSAAPRVPVANGVTVYRGSANATPSSRATRLSRCSDAYAGSPQGTSWVMA
ncbi:hypothetical protein ACV33Q_31595, partial [Pseudomonas aeruginosa]